MRISFLVTQIIFCCFIFISSHAQVSSDYHPLSKSILLSIGGGGTYTFSDYANPDFGPYIGGSVEYYFPTRSNNIFGLKLSGEYSELNGTENNLGFTGVSANFSSKVFGAGLGIVYSYAVNKKFLPFVSLEANYLVFDFNNANMESSFYPNLINGLEESSMAVKFMGGTKFKINDKFDINVGLGYNHVLNDNSDGIEYGEEKDFYFNGMVGLSFRIWNQRDSDNDGIIDDIDKCPYEEEDIDGFEDEDGCPDPDNDGDGIIDFKDGCQNIPEDIDGFMDEDGCPDPDNDGDGILDSEDSCPDVAEDFDGFEDQDGCPDADNDGDGILDKDDKCVDEAEVFNGFQDEDGCPDELPKPVYVEPTPRVIKRTPKPTQNNVNTKKPVTNVQSSFLVHSETTFNPNSAQIKSTAFGELNRIVAEIRKAPNSNWRIEGHCDTKTSRSEANRITKSQADAVLEYFVSQGLPANKFQSLGFGDATPIASNSSVYGRMKNRRIIIRKID